MLALAGASIFACAYGGCSYDFDAPFNAAGNLGVDGGGIGGASGAGGTGTAGSGGMGGSGGSGGAAGTGGAGGAAGSGGIAGSAGSAATGGTGGAAGASGTAGSAGIAGSAGSAATGGTGGTAGASGTAGTGGSGGVGGTGGSGGSTIVEGHTCTVDPGGTGAEPDGLIPVCCAPSSSEAADILDLVTLLNAHRAANSVPEVTYDLDLEATIQAHLIHQSLHPFTSWDAPESVVATVADRAGLCGTATTGGVFVGNVSSATSAMNQWKNNSTYNDFILSPTHVRVGGGHYGSQWGLQFGP